MLESDFPRVGTGAVGISTAPRDDGSEVVAAELATDPIVCHCLQVRESAVVRAISTGEVDSLWDVIRCTGAGDGCTACHRAIRRYFSTERALPAR